MKLSRRGLFKSAGALAVAAAVKRVQPAAMVLHGDGVTDDTAALQAWGRGEHVVRPDGSPVGPWLSGGAFLVRDAITISRKDSPGLIGNNFHYKPTVQDRCLLDFPTSRRAG